MVKTTVKCPNCCCCLPIPREKGKLPVLLMANQGVFFGTVVTVPLQTVVYIFWNRGDTTKYRGITTDLVVHTVVLKFMEHLFGF